MSFKVNYAQKKYFIANILLVMFRTSFSNKDKINITYYTNENFLYGLLYKWLTCHPVKDTKSDNVNSVLCNLPE